jgi:hypothetical protein
VVLHCLALLVCFGIGSWMIGNSGVCWGEHDGKHCGKRGMEMSIMNLTAFNIHQHHNMKTSSHGMKSMLPPILTLFPGGWVKPEVEMTNGIRSQFRVS